MDGRRPASVLRAAFRATALAEGVVLPALVLLAVLKSLLPAAAVIAILGVTHAGLWVCFLVMAAGLWQLDGWQTRTAGVAAAASLVPFGTWWFERRWLSDEHS